MAISDLQARGIILQALAQRGLAVGPAAVQITQAIAKHESGYGVLLGEQHHNWGAVHCVHGPPCGEGCFEGGDKDGSGKGYPTCLRSYQSDVQGAADMVRELYRRPHVAAALAAGDVLATARAMAVRAHGIGVYHQSPPEQYATAVYKHAKAIAAGLGEPLAAQWSRLPPPPAPQPAQWRPTSPQPPPSKPASVWPWMLGMAALFVAARRSADRRGARTFTGRRS